MKYNGPYVRLMCGPFFLAALARQPLGVSMSVATSAPSRFALVVCAIVALCAGAAGLSQTALAQDAPAKAPAQALTQAQMVDMLKVLDDRQKNVGDYKALVVIDQKEKGKAQRVYEAVVYRRDAKDKMAIMFLRPKADAGKGYLRMNKNMFFYDPNVGKWERRTERDSIGGTNSRGQDFDASSLAADYDPSYVGLEKLGKFSVHHLKLKVKKGQDVAYPTLDIWVDVGSGNILKLQEKALSGRLIRTSYYPKWMKVKNSKKKGGFVYVPKQIRIFDEIEKSNTTTVVTRKVDVTPLKDNIFTKAWFESKSR